MISPYAIFRAYLQTLYDIPYAKEVAQVLEVDKQLGIMIDGEKEERLRLTPLFEARQRGTERAIRELMERDQIRQILELEAGISTQGLIYTKHYFPFTYVETGSSENLKIKRKLVRAISPETPLGLHLVPTDYLLLTDLMKAKRFFKPKKPVIILNIGLLSSLNNEEQKLLAQNIYAILTRFGGYWVTPDPAMHDARRREISLHYLTEMISEQKNQTEGDKAIVDNSFADESEADRFFTDNNFVIEKRPQLDNYKLISPTKLKFSPQQKRLAIRDLDRFGKVWILSAGILTTDWLRQ